MVSNLSSHFDFSPPHLDYNNHPADHLPSVSTTLSLASCLHSINFSPPSSDCLPHSLTLSPLPCVYSLTSINDHDNDSYTECVKNAQKWAVPASLAYQATFR